MITDDLAREILRELRAIRHALERHPAPDLVQAILGYFGHLGRFTAAGVLAAAEDSTELADALSNAIDMNAPPQARVVSLGRLLGSLPDLEVVATRRGARVWQVRG